MADSRTYLASSASELTDDDLNTLDEALAFNRVSDKRVRTALQSVLHAYRELRKLLETPYAPGIKIDATGLIHSDEALTSFSADEAFAYGAALIRAAMEARGR